MKAPEFWWKPDNNGTSIASTLLSPIAALYGYESKRRISKIEDGYKSKLPVICVGNLTAGGTGKTPTALLVAQRLAAMGQHPAILSRGYGGKLTGPVKVDPSKHRPADVGDEPLLLAAHTNVYVAQDREEGARLIEQDGTTSHIILDDGFQNPTLKKDLSILVVDASRGFGNGKLIPAGPLREPIDYGLQRADAVLVIGDDAATKLDTIIPADTKNLARLTGKLEPGAESLWLQGQPVTAYCGIGNPDKFFNTLEKLGVNLVGKFAFPDHHTLKPQELLLIERHMTKTGSLAVTTEKDAVKLPASARGKIMTVRVDLQLDEPVILDDLLGRVIQG